MGGCCSAPKASQSVHHTHKLDDFGQQQQKAEQARRAQQGALVQHKTVSSAPGAEQQLLGCWPQAAAFRTCS